MPKTDRKKRVSLLPHRRSSTNSSFLKSKEKRLSTNIKLLKKETKRLEKELDTLKEIARLDEKAKKEMDTESFHRYLFYMNPTIRKSPRKSKK